MKAESLKGQPQSLGDLRELSPSSSASLAVADVHFRPCQLWSRVMLFHADVNKPMKLLMMYAEGNKGYVQY